LNFVSDHIGDDLYSYIEALLGENVANRAIRCGYESSHMLSCDVCGSVHFINYQCNLYRLCPDCAKRRGSQLFAQYWHAIRQFKNPRLVTLTIRNVEELSPDVYKFIRSAFSKLRRRKVLGLVQGGIYVIETTHKGKGWHIHIHALVDAVWIENRKGSDRSLREEWIRVTNGKGMVVDVRRASPRGGLRYIMKYITKPAHFSHPLHYALYLEATKNQRLIQTFGSAYDLRPLKIPWAKNCPDCDAGILHYTGDLAYFERLAREWWPECFIETPDPPDDFQEVAS